MRPHVDWNWPISWEKKPKNRPVCKNGEKSRGLVMGSLIFREIIKSYIIQRRQTNDSWPKDKHEFMIDHTHNPSSCEITDCKNSGRNGIRTHNFYLSSVYNCADQQ